MRVLMTGATGFVGTRLIPKLNQRGVQLTGISRGLSGNLSPNPGGSYSHEIFDIAPAADWHHLLDNKDAVVHLADGFNAYEKMPATTHDQAAFERAEATLNLVRQAIKAGVPKLIYLSTIKAICGASADEILDENTTPKPTCLYGQLKLETERKITQLSKGSETNVIILRFPVVFGKKADGNFTWLLKLADTPVPLPFKDLKNRRSMISRTSLTDAIATVVADQGAKRGTFHIHDDAVSVAQLIAELRTGLDRPQRLFQAPHLMWQMMQALPKINEITYRFTRSLELTDAKFRQEFPWLPSVTMAEELRRTARAYRRSAE